MGVKNLWDILESCKKTLPLHHLQNKRVCIDLSCWMVQLAHVNKSHCSMKDKLYLKGLFHRIRALIALNCSIIFVTDGSIPGIKVSTYRRRLQLDNEGTRDESSSNQNTSLQRNMGSEFSCMIKETKILGSTLGVPCIDGIEEGEAQCALLDSESLCDGCFSADSDIFLFGARTVYRDICLGEGGYVVCYEMADIEKNLGFGRNSLIALAVLLGCDYSPRVRGLGPELACQIVKSLGESAVLQRLASEELSVLKKAVCSKKHNQVLGFNNKENIAPRDSNINVLQKLASEELSVLKKANCSKKRNQVLGFNNKENIAPRDSNINGHKSNLSKNDQFLQVMEAYLKPKCHLADSQMVQRVLGMHSFQRTRLLQTCHRFFEWPPEKTDEYILPKIAERDLRRFANLRSTSSRLGVQPPLDMMPVKCPVSEIIKRRKAQGKECFEVSWEDVDGLSSSIVPGELVESACPEKIVEFEEKIAEKKKPKPRKPRLKKSETNKSLSEAETKLQELVLEIEGANSYGQNYRLIDEPLGNAGSYMEEMKMTENTRKSCSDIETEVVNLCTPMAMKLNGKVETEIVDLLSPLSVVCPFKNRAVDVIDLSESETDVSPEHAANKAKELRLFEASMRNDFSSSG